MKNITTALLFFCAFNLTNATAASAPGGVPLDDLLGTGAAARGAYFPDHDYLKYTPKEMLPEIAKELHGALTKGSQQLGGLNIGELEWAVDSYSTAANTINCLLGPDIGFDKKCESIFKKLLLLKERMVALQADPEKAQKLQPAVKELQLEIEEAASLVSRIAFPAELDGKSKK
ncbi:MAG: hypothetical protein NT128_05070 [Proteobacteria bacterium]|nr:hypothetical protein [Pseudomonadota bacterium]